MRHSSAPHSMGWEGLQRQKKTTHVVGLDFKKAFGAVPHALLMQKLKQTHDMHSQLVNWVQDFFGE